MASESLACSSRLPFYPLHTLLLLRKTVGMLRLPFVYPDFGSPHYTIPSRLAADLDPRTQQVGATSRPRVVRSHPSALLLLGWLQDGNNARWINLYHVS